MVYLPTEEEREFGRINEPLDRGRIYKMVSSSGNQCFFIPQSISNAIIPAKVLGANNKAEKSWDGEMIKNICIPVKVDRLGNVIKIKYKTNE